MAAVMGLFLVSDRKLTAIAMGRGRRYGSNGMHLLEKADDGDPSNPWRSSGTGILKQQRHWRAVKGSRQKACC